MLCGVNSVQDPATSEFPDGCAISVCLSRMGYACSLREPSIAIGGQTIDL